MQVREPRLDRGWGQASVTPANLSGYESPERLSAGRVTSGFFGRVLGTPPILGRDFLDEEDDLGSEARVALLSHDFWRQRFGEDAAVLGRALTPDGEVHSVVGVLAPGTPWLDEADVYLPMPRRGHDLRASFELPVLGRLKPGVTREAGLADLERIASTLAELHPEADAGMGIRLEGSETWLTDSPTRRTLWILLRAVGFLSLLGVGMLGVACRVACHVASCDHPILHHKLPLRGPTGASSPFSRRRPWPFPSVWLAAPS
ncbi:MAG TPA: ABC transporter permease [Longimicrobiales bacterium]|nr:ABC transporter permease [Longimicrobiales bacterium]